MTPKTNPETNTTLENSNGDIPLTASEPAHPTPTEPPQNAQITLHSPPNQTVWKANPIYIVLIAIAIMGVGLLLNNSLLGIGGAFITLVVSFLIILPWFISVLDTFIPPADRIRIIAGVGILSAIFVLLQFFGSYKRLTIWAKQVQWDAFGSLAEWTGAVGQIFIAILAVYIAWQQYVISRDLTLEQNRLTSQQNILTQQQTIDAYFQGISDLALDDEGLLEDWPQERSFCEGRTAAILASVDAAGKAKVLRFLSQSRLLNPLKRDRHLGRPILNGNGSYEEDRNNGVRVIDIGIMLAGADLSNTDLRWTELSDANLIRANLTGCDLVKANLSRTILYEASLAGADIKGSRLFYGSVETATPRSRTEIPDYKTGLHTGAVVENADFSEVQRMDEQQRYYCCAWGGSKTRQTIPGGCDGIPNKLGR